MVQNSGSVSDESFILSSESVTEGHRGKVCDYISDSILNAYLAEHQRCHVACEALCKSDIVVLAGEITSQASADHEAMVRQAIRECGYTDNSQLFSADKVKIVPFITQQAQEIATAVAVSALKFDQLPGFHSHSSRARFVEPVHDEVRGLGCCNL